MISRCQFLSLQSVEQVEAILEKRGLAERLETDAALPHAICHCLSNPRPDEVEAVLDEIVNSQRLLYRATASPEYLYNERWEDLMRCVALDGYQIRSEFVTGYEINRVDPTIEAPISRARATSRPAGFDESRWGQVIAHLRTSGFVSQEEEKGLAGVCSFLRPGSHMFIGLSQQETARLGRSFAPGMCYFLVKKYNG